MNQSKQKADALKALVGRALANGWNSEDANQLDFNACALGRAALAVYEASGPEEPVYSHPWPHDFQLAQWFYETYERLAPSFGYETRKDSAKPWEEVPDKNKKLMTAVCREILIDLSKAKHAPTEPAKPAEAEGISDVDAFSRWNDCATDDDGTMEAFYAGIAYARAKPALRQKKDTKTSCNDTK